MFDKFVKTLTHVLEIILSLIVLAAVIVGVCFLYKPFLEFIKSNGSSQAFMVLLGNVLTVVVGVEFFRVLYKPQVQILLEVLTFVLARHMIVNELSALEDLIIIASISIIVLIRYFVFTKDKK